MQFCLSNFSVNKDIKFVYYKIYPDHCFLVVIITPAIENFALEILHEYFEIFMLNKF
jgi:hypothetical protein